MAAKEHPSWILETGLLSTVLPEPPYLQKLFGAQRTDAEALYDEALSDGAFDALAQAGTGLVWLRFFAGCGVEFEKKHMELVRDSIVRLHARGVKAAVRISLGALFPETLQIEEPDCLNWLQVNHEGHHPLAGDLCRVRPCCNSEGYLRYIERICNLAIDYEADLIHFDQFGSNPEPDTCRCPVCIAAFRDFLRQQYGVQDEQTRAAGAARFGHNHFLHTRPPVLAAGDLRTPSLAGGGQPLESPHMQEWLRFKVSSLGQCLERLAQTVSKRQPGCAISADLFQDFGANSEWLHGTSAELQLPSVDAVRLVSLAPAWSGESEQLGGEKTARLARRARVSDGQLELFGASESAPAAAVEPEKAVPAARRPELTGAQRERIQRLWSLARALKTAKSFNAAVDLPACADDAAVLGLALACNPLLLNADANPAGRDCRAFVSQHRQDVLLGACSLASVAVFRDLPSLEFGGQAVRQHMQDTEELLLERNIPYELLHAAQLDRLSRCRCVVLPDCISLSEELAARFEAFVQEGGGLVITGETGRRDPWRRIRPESLFGALLGAEPRHAVHREAGGGRAAYAAGSGIYDAVRFAAGAAFPVQIECPSGTVLAEPVKLSSGALALHVVNLGTDAARAVNCALVCEFAPQQVLPLAFAPAAGPLAFQYDNGRVFFTLDSVESYMLVKIVP